MADYHLQTVGICSLAMTMLAASLGLRYSAGLSPTLFVGSIVLAVLAVAECLIGFGIIPCIVWIIGVSIGLLRWTPGSSGAVQALEPGTS